MPSTMRSSSRARGDGHLFADNSLPDHDGPAASLLMERVLAFLDRLT